MSRSTLVRSHSILTALSFALALTLSSASWAVPPGQQDNPNSNKGNKYSVDAGTTCALDNPYAPRYLTAITAVRDQSGDGEINPANSWIVSQQVQEQIGQGKAGLSNVGNPYSASQSGSAYTVTQHTFDLCDVNADVDASTDDAVSAEATGVNVAVTISVAGGLGKTIKQYCDDNPEDPSDDLDFYAPINCGLTATTTDTTSTVTTEPLTTSTDMTTTITETTTTESTTETATTTDPTATSTTGL